MDWVWLGVTNWTSHYNLDSLKVSLKMFYLNLMDPMLFLFRTLKSFIGLLGVVGWGGQIPLFEFDF